MVRQDWMYARGMSYFHTLYRYNVGLSSHAYGVGMVWPVAA